MISITNYFYNLYRNAGFEEAYECEMAVYDMDNDDFENWAEEHNIDLTITDSHGITALQYWLWNFED